MKSVNYKKLVNIAIKPIFLAVNGPTTCLNWIDQLGKIAKKLALPIFTFTDSRTLKSKKIQVDGFNFEEFIDLCYNQIFF